ncbi:MAG: T9SS type A sorting domain-containing protein [Ignavibacteria bacterium]|nr:T9SS type A sorting domain-containing protein [Ignavibacteria bacterium]
MKTFVTFFLMTVKFFSQSLPFPIDTLVADDKFNNRQTMILDSEGKIRLVYSGQSGTQSNTREIYFLEERANGQFSREQITNNNVDENYPTVSLDADGKVHIGMIGRDASSNYQVLYSNNRNGTFFPPRFITIGGDNKATPASCVGPDGKVHFLYYTFTSNPDKVYYKWFNPADSSSSTDIYLADGETSGDLDGQILFDRNGKMHLVFKGGNVSTGILRYFNDISGTLTEYSTGVSVSIANPKLVIDKNNKVHIIFRNESQRALQYINNVAGAFSTPVSFTPAGQLPSGYANFAIDDEGTLFFVYQSSQSASGKGFFLKYLKNGTFSDTLRIYDLTPEYVTRNTSAVVAKGNGEIAVTFSPAGVRNSVVFCDILMKRGKLFKEPHILVRDSVINFGTTPVLQNSERELIIRNTGDTTLAINSFRWNSNEFAIRLDYPENIAPGDSDIATFAFIPRTPGPKLDTLFIRSNDPRDSVIKVVLKGYGSAPPQISLSKDSLFLVYSSGWHTRDSFYVRNTGFDTLSVDTLTATGWFDFFKNFEPLSAVVPPGDSAVIYVELLIPVFMTPPVFTDTIFVHSNDPLRPRASLIVRWEQPQSAKDEPLPTEYSLKQNYPNPFNPETVIAFTLKESSPVRLEIFNTSGELVKTLVNKQLNPGKYSIGFNARNLPSGTYFYRITAGSFTNTKKMILLR